MVCIYGKIFVFLIYEGKRDEVMVIVINENVLNSLDIIIEFNLFI